MIIVRLKGGLGNQMFQYAMGRKLSFQRNQPLKLDLGFLKTVKHNANVTARDYELSIFNIKEDFASDEDVRKYTGISIKILTKFLPFYASPYAKEKHFHFDPSVENSTKGKYFDGHWVSEKYFQGIEPIIRSEFSFKKKVLNQAQPLNAQINNSNSVCIQVRRGDYVHNPAVAKLHQTTSLDYFEKGISFIKSKVTDPVFFIFSDDIKWCQENFKSLEHVHFVEKILEGQPAGNSDYLQLMMGCKHFIISNSTFAWWAAWLSVNPNKIVVAPQNWFNDNKIITKDVYPLSWIKI